VTEISDPEGFAFISNAHFCKFQEGALDEMYYDSMKARPTRNPPSAWLRLDWFVSADNAHTLQPPAPNPIEQFVA
jgi:hypothetical protein